MSTPTLSTPMLGQPLLPLYRFSVEDYHRMIQAGVFARDERVELLEGQVIRKMPRNPPHDNALQRTRRRLEALLGTRWEARIQSAVTLPDSEPEPDISVVRGQEWSDETRHPGPAEIALLVEVSDSTLAYDRQDKGRVYARAGIPTYWIVNLVDRQVEVYTAPSGPTAAAGYAQQQLFTLADSVAVELDGVILGTIAVADLIH